MQREFAKFAISGLREKINLASSVGMQRYSFIFVVITQYQLRAALQTEKNVLSALSKDRKKKIMFF